MKPIILLLEDDSLSLSSTQRIIEEQVPAQVIAINSADSAMSSIEKYAQLFSAFILDIEMPNQRYTGIDIAYKIRQIAGCEHTPIIFLTSHVHFGGAALKAIHYFDFIQKPFDDTILIRSLQQALALSPPIGIFSEIVHFDGPDMHYQLDASNILCVEMIRNKLVVTDCENKDTEYPIKAKSFASICDQISHMQIPLQQVHRCYIVNLHRIKEIRWGKNTATLSLFNSNKQIPVGKTFLNILTIYNK